MDANVLKKISMWNNANLEASLRNELNNLSDYVQRYKIVTLVCVLIFFVFCIIQRLYGTIPYGHIVGIRMDTFLTLSILLISLLYIRNTSWLYKPLSILGKHSINIYLIHTFFNHYWEFSRNLLHDSHLRIGGGKCDCITFCMSYDKYFDRVA